MKRIIATKLHGTTATVEHVRYVAAAFYPGRIILAFILDPFEMSKNLPQFAHSHGLRRITILAQLSLPPEAT